MNPSVLFTALVVGVLSIAAWARLAELHRASSLARAAVALGWRYERYANSFVQRGPGALSLFRVGGGLARNLVTDGRLALFDYIWRAGYDARRADGPSLAVGAARVEGTPAFRLEFKRPGAFGLTSSVQTSADEVELSGPRAFADNYRLFGEDVEAVRALFTPPVVAFFAANPGWCVESNGTWLVAYEVVGHLDPRRLGAQVDALRRIVALCTPTPREEPR